MSQVDLYITEQNEYSNRNNMIQPEEHIIYEVVREMHDGAYAPESV